MNRELTENKTNKAQGMSFAELKDRIRDRCGFDPDTNTGSTCAFISMSLTVDGIGWYWDLESDSFCRAPAFDEK